MNVDIEQHIHLLGDWAPGKISVNTSFHLHATCINLEGPVISDTKRLTPIEKVGPHLFSTSLPTFTSHLIASIANNHIMDYGVNGVRETINNLEELGFLSNGFIENSSKQIEPTYFSHQGKKIGFLAVGEDQFGSSRFNSQGYRSSIFLTSEVINEVKKHCDFMIVSFHGGIENHLVPSPARQNRFRSFIEAGANIVYGHHTHIPQGWEFYKKGLIFYGLGNFATDPGVISHSKLGAYSLAPAIDIHDLSKTKFYVTKQTLENNAISISRHELHNSDLRTYFSQLNTVTSDRDEVLNIWKVSSVDNFELYYQKSLGIGLTSIERLKRIILISISRLKSWQIHTSNYEKMERKIIFHFFANDSHSELISDSLSIEINAQRSYAHIELQKVVDEIG